ncbi:unnamed protein product [Rotaria magnacalcarata]|uniref:Elongation of very long chain fatty acids protein n=2 Tax=Rotaria magnacalcarata TaxID=392030 RepID=A0A814RQM6_9BILA|nr:unnamed protein product [Rotaria magnacalcarata]
MDLFATIPQNGDIRVKDWPLMQSVIPTVLIIVAYIFFIIFGRKWMKNKNAFELRDFMLVYNIVQVILCTYITYEATYVWIKERYSFTCQPIDFSKSETAMKACKACWWFYIMKLVDLTDTILFVLRKKDEQITFLHVYHHITMTFCGWSGSKYVGGGQSLFVIIINSFIHVIMYGYYGLSACGPKIQKYLWWKRYITQAQMLQFVAVIIHSIVNLRQQCIYSVIERTEMRSILCYGDSNTWGFVPGSFGIRERFDRNTRWTGRLQQLLDPAYFYVIEEGLNSRTTNLDYGDRPNGFRGTEFLSVILYTHAPLDLVIIMLGLNDLKKQFNNRTSQQIAEGIKELIDIIRSTTYGSNMQESPAILIVSTPIPVETSSENPSDMFEGAKERIQDLADELKTLVNKYDKNVYFVDAAPSVQMSPVDGIHFDATAHEQFALLMNKTIRKIFNLPA